MNLSVKDAARLLNVSEKTIYRWIKEELIPAYRVQGQHRFNQAELCEWATSRRMGLTPEAFHEPDEAASPPPRLSDALEEGGIIYRLEGSTRDEALTSLVKSLRLPEGLDRDYLLRVLIAREELASTGLGNGIALPHPRNPGLLHATLPSVTLAFLENPVDFHALDGKPVRALFCVISPTLRAHLHLLAMLGFALDDPKFVAAIHAEERRETIFAALREVKKRMGLIAQS